MFKINVTAHKTSLTPSRFIEVSASDSTIVLLYFINIFQQYGIFLFFFCIQFHY